MNLRQASECLAVMLVLVLVPDLASSKIMEEWADGAPTLRAYPGGTWDFGRTALWTSDGGVTREVWSDNSDVVRVTMQSGAWASATVNVDASSGVVGCHALETGGEIPSWTYVIFDGDAFTVGAGGVTDGILSPNSHLQFKAPVVLGAAQVWRAFRLSSNNSTGTVLIDGGLSSENEVSTPLVFDGCGLSDPDVLSSSGKRVIFSLSKPSLVNGSITVQNGAALSFGGYSQATMDANPFDKSKPLILRGGSIFVNGKPGSPIEADDLVVGAGYSAIRGYNSGSSFSFKSIRRDGLGGTIDFPVSWNGGLSAVFTGEADGEDWGGGWLVFNGSNLAKVGTGGTISQVTTKDDRPNNLKDDVHYLIKTYPGEITSVKDVSPISLNIAVSNVLDYSGWTISLQSGALISTAKEGANIVGGTFRSGYATGELFLYAFCDMVFSGSLVDNGDIPLSLVKGGAGTLTLSGEQAYTGATYLNGGTLKLSDGAAVPGAVIQSGATTLELGDGGILNAAAGLSLGGNLKLDKGSRIDIMLALNGGVSLTNDFASLETDGELAGVKLKLSFPDGVIPSRGVYPLLSWNPEKAAVTGVTAESFEVVPPRRCTGRLVLTDGLLSYAVTSVGSGFMVRIR